ncbi:hypothetical protein FSP39_015487 [Pinctada imbricata]|uniref:Ribosomal protein eL8/eL30/eS12/Gadd45 domain-containing protein n=1 Tax=Pinctada imbricata TaxID=66713 RepID=A0AA88Y1B9_PINIB|nr:hypothetical protein FSP39_015487 [Pinctada imbricata]
MVTKAMVEGRTTCGVIACAQLLNTNPDDVTLCILPVETDEDVTIHIQHTLIEAFCWENDIVTVKVDSTEKLGMLFSALGSTNYNNNNKVAEDYNCVLISCPQTTATDHTLNDIVNADDHPIIEIPVD